MPKRSAIQPEAGISIAIVSEYDTTTDCMRSGLSPRLRAMAGRAVLTMVASSVCMKKPQATSQSKALSSFCSLALTHGIFMHSRLDKLQHELVLGLRRLWRILVTRV